MKIQTWLRLASDSLKKVGIDTNQLDNLILLEHATKQNKAYILAHQDEELSAEQTLELNILLTRRCKREPIAYITGKKEFYGRVFIVNKDVLIPRPESESFIELLKNYNLDGQNVIDVGCGSGILGITIKLEVPSLDVTLVDIDEKALEVAKHNAKNLSANCNFAQSDLLPVNSNFTVVLANLPYVPKNLDLQPELNYEPPNALFAENQGMLLYRQLWKQVSQSSSIDIVLTESLKIQHKLMTELAAASNFKLLNTNGLVQFYKKESKVD